MKQRVATLASLLAISSACGGVPAGPSPGPQVVRTAVQDAALRQMLLDGARAQACDKLRGRFLPLPAPEDEGMVAADAGLVRSGGRWMVEGCSQAPASDSSVAITLAGPGWLWVDRTESKGGGTFQVRQHVYFFAQTTMTVSLDVGYQADARIAYVWLQPTQAASASFKTTGELHAGPKNFLGRFWSKVTDVDGRARTTADEVGRQRFEQALSMGQTLTYSTMTGQLDSAAGVIGGGNVPRRPFALPRWLMNERQLVRPGAVQLAGPFPMASMVNVQVTLEAGPKVSYGLICARDAAALARQFAGGPPEPLPSLELTTVLPGEAARPARPPPCDWVMMTAADAEASIAVGIWQ